LAVIFLLQYVMNQEMDIG